MAVSATEAVLPAVEPAGLRSPLTPAPAALSRPILSTVIVNFCQWNNTARLVRQLGRAEADGLQATEVVVIDNHSPPHVWMERLRRDGGVSLRRFARNRGFARAVNEGCRLARGDWLLILNPDMTAPPGFLDKALAVIRQVERDRPGAGVIGFRLRHADGSLQASCGRFPTLLNTLTGLFRPRRTRKCSALEVQTPTAVPWVTGCCLLVRRDCLEELGGFDEAFFLYYEDVDLCRRAARAGWSVWFEPGVELTHHSPLHTRDVPAALRLITRHALLTYARKHWPAWQRRLLEGVVSLEAAWRRRQARWRGRRESEHFHRELGELVDDLRHARAGSVRNRLRRAARRLERTARLADADH